MSRQSNSEEIRLLTKISKLYYEEGIRQEEIVSRLNLSRSKVSRMLQKAREEGIVRITVLEPAGIYTDLETRLEKKFELQEAIVVEAHQPESQLMVAREIGIAAADYLARSIQPNDTVGVSWGSTLNEMVEELEPMDLPGVQVVQIIGGLGRPESELHATDLCRRMARRLNCKMSLLPVPGIVKDEKTRAAFLSDNHVQHTLQLFNQIKIAFVGIGVPSLNSVVMRDGEILSHEELQALVLRGAVGDIALRYFDVYGQSVPSELNHRIIGIDMTELSKVKHVVGIAGGPLKMSSILGALRGKLINVLITDHITANQLDCLELE